MNRGKVLVSKRFRRIGSCKQSYPQSVDISVYKTLFPCIGFIKIRAGGGLLTFLSLWDQVNAQLKNEISTLLYNTWISQLTPLSYADGKFVLACPNTFIKNIIVQHYAHTIRQLLETYAKGPVLLILTEPADPKYSSYEKMTSGPQEEKKPVPEEDTNINSNLSPRYTFDNFVRGKSNELAYAGSVAVTEQPGLIYNPLFIYGGVGLGKTHLINACALSIQQKFPNLRVVYISSEKFTNELVTSIREQKNEEFRNRYRNVDVLLVDDIQFIAGKEATQEEFFHTFNELYNDNKQIILSSDKPPHEIKTLEDRLRSRFEMGLITDIGPPDYETRVAILQEKMRMHKTVVPPEVLAYVASNIQSNIRELEGALTKIIAQSIVQKIPVTLELAQASLEKTLGLQSKQPMTIERIIEVLAQEYGLDTQDFYSKNRSKKIAYPRQIAMYLSRELTDLSLIKIANHFDKDHSTVIYGIEKIKNDMENDVQFAESIQVIRQRLES